MTLVEAAKKYRQWAGSVVAESTALQYGRIVERMARKWPARDPLGLKRVDVTEFYAEASGSKKSASTASGVAASIKHFWKWMRVSGMEPDGSAIEKEVFGTRKSAPGRHRHYTHAELDRIRALDPVAALAVELGLNCAYQPQDLAALRWEHFLEQKIGGKRYRLAALPRPKTGRPRLATLWSETTSALEMAREMGELGGDYLFVRRRGLAERPLTSNAVRYLWRKWCKAAGVPQYGCRTLRHMCATRLAAAGMPMAEIQRVTGHADLRSLEKYIHTDWYRQDAIERMAKLGKDQEPEKGPAE